jgi:hypothetical protein
VEIPVDEQGSIQAGDPEQPSEEEFDFPDADYEEPDVDEPSPREIDTRDHLSPREVPSPSTLPVVLSRKLGSSREAKDISHFFERGDKKTGKKTICIPCRCVLDGLEIDIPYTNI